MHLEGCPEKIPLSSHWPPIYLDWEFGLVKKLGQDGTRHFWVL
jgi:hypothetical protein